MHLNESTSLKEVTLQLRGKARLPSLAADSGYVAHSCSTELGSKSCIMHSGAYFIRIISLSWCIHMTGPFLPVTNAHIFSRQADTSFLSRYVFCQPSAIPVTYLPVLPGRNRPQNPQLSNDNKALLGYFLQITRYRCSVGSFCKRFACPTSRDFTAISTS